MACEDEHLKWVTAPDFTEALELAEGADVESWRLKLPAKGACYLLEDEAGVPVLLSTCADLRAAVVNRMTGVEGEVGEKTKRIDYAAVVSRVRWRGTYSRFEADWTYLENARRIYPDTYRPMTKRWRAHWIEADVEGPYPRFTTTETPSAPPDRCFGPFAEPGAAKRVVEALEDIFDLCRYHHILVLSPRGEACAYKQMGRCPAPCDGSIAMGVYRGQVRAALEFLHSPREPWAESLRGEMARAAASKEFEKANRCKQMLERAKALDARASSRLAPLTEFRWLFLRRGSRKHSVRVFIVTPGGIIASEEIGKKERDMMLPRVMERLAHAALIPNHPVDAQRMGLAAWHIFHGQRDDGCCLRAASVTPESLREGIEQIWSSRAAVTPVE